MIKIDRFSEFVDLMTARFREKESREDVEKVFRLFDDDNSGRFVFIVDLHVKHWIVNDFPLDSVKFDRITNYRGYRFDHSSEVAAGL